LEEATSVGTRSHWGRAEGAQSGGTQKDHRFRSAAYWRERAEAARNMAETMTDGFAKNMMLEIASMYTKLWKHAAASEAEEKRRQ
jgi:hypothetical protein